MGEQNVGQPFQAAAPTKAVQVIRAQEAGFCPGVKRALAMIDAALADGSALCSLGPLIHNTQVVSQLSERGLREVGTLEEAQGATLVIRTHGVPAAVFQHARELNIPVIDATCPFVRRAHQRARELLAAGYTLCIVGDRDHPEVAAIIGSVDRECYVFETLEEAVAAPSIERVGLVAQTTQTGENFQAIVGALAARCEELLAYNTICSATAERQQAARRLASEADVVLVVGGRHSANTRRLAQICQSAGAKTFHIETAAEVQPEWLVGARVIGVTAGASTPSGEIAALEARALELATPVVSCQFPVASPQPSATGD